MNTKADSAYKFGCGRYIEQHGALQLAGQEACRLGSRGLIVGGPHTLPLVREKLAHSLGAAGCGFAFAEYSGPCSEEAAYEFASLCKKDQFDLVIGVGGGRMMDVAKLIAALAKCPVINIPTSSATCAAYTPLSVVYTPEGKARGSWYLEREVDCILADLDILCVQPTRLANAGMMDAVAKHIEIIYHLRKGMTKAADVSSAAVLAQTLYDQLLLKHTEMFPPKDDTGCWNTIYLCIAVTGMISGITRGAFQSAIGHAFYEAVRTMWPRESAAALHGEIVAVGLLIQERFCRCSSSFETIKALMKAANMPTSVRALGLAPNEGDLAALAALPFFKPYVESRDIKTLESAIRSLL